MLIHKVMFGVSTAPRRLLGRGEPQDQLVPRIPLIFLGMMLWAMAILGRLIWLQVIQHRHYAKKAGSLHYTSIAIPAVRGELRDRRGQSLALSRRVESLFVHPGIFYPDDAGALPETRKWTNPNRKLAEQVASKLSPVLEMSKQRLMEKLLTKKSFVYLQRQLLPSKADEIRALKIEQVGFLQESKRVYPMGSLACQILGFTDIDGVGQLGIERTHQDQLAGKAGRLEAPRDAKGRLLILQENYSQVPVNGTTLQLSIDASIQHITEQALQECVDTLNPKGAYAVVVDPNTGEILAIAGTPTFDPNHPLPQKFMNRADSELSPAEKEEKRLEVARQQQARRVRPVEDTYEPGSTMKVFTAAIALEERKVRLGEMIDCRGPWVVNGKPIKDAHPMGVVSFEEVLWQSSNIGTARFGLRLEPATHYQYLRKFGFGEKTGLNFPGESAGLFYAPDRWSGTTQQTICFGYGISATPLQVLMAGCAIANGGRLMQPILVQKIFNDRGELMHESRPKVRQQVISEETSSMMRDVLKGVITQGTAKKAALEGGVEAFGKTGSTRKFDPATRQWLSNKHFSSFMGFFPANKPQFGILFMIDEPGRGLTGGDVAAPLFKKVGDAIMRYHTTGTFKDQEPDKRLQLREWPASGDDEVRVHVERGKVPDVKGLPLRSAIYRVILSGGTALVEQGGALPEGPMKVTDQWPVPGSPLETGKPVLLKVKPLAAVEPSGEER